ncbi:hypothetical protein SNEBB_010743 [Seison nebaliae]|nr:hypothetical protein SNEBB_010743 [Seison nebaliae]
MFRQLLRRSIKCTSIISYRGRGTDRYLRKSQNRKSLGDYEYPEQLVSNAHHSIRMIKEMRSKIDRPRKEHIVTILDDISNELCIVADFCEFIRHCHSEEEWRAVADETYQLLANHVEELNSDFELYKLLEKVVEIDNGLDVKQLFPTNLTQKHLEKLRHVGKLFLHDFRLSGVQFHKGVKEREEFLHINKQLQEAMSAFSIESIKSIELSRNRIPEIYHSFYEFDKNDKTNFPNAMIIGANEEFRKFHFSSFHNNVSNGVNLFNMTNNRCHLAKVCGFDNFTEKSLADLNCYTTVNEVNGFLSSIGRRLYEKFERKMSNFNQLVNSRHEPFQLDLYDSAHFEFYARKKCSMKSYKFPLPETMMALDNLLKRVFHVRLEVEEMKLREEWTIGLVKLNVVDCKTNEEIGTIFCDFLSRPDKFNSDCHFTVRCGKSMRHLNETYQKPIVVLNLNLGRNGKSERKKKYPIGVGQKFSKISDEIILLDSNELENLFHEFGHAMHSMFARTIFQHVSGTRCKTDWAEVPSQLFENWARHPEMIRTILPQFSLDEIGKYSRDKKQIDSFFEYLSLQNQLYLSVIDQRLHQIEEPFTSTHRMEEALSNPTLFELSMPSFQYSSNRPWHKFSHLTAYGGKYMIYLWSKAVAQSIWRESFEDNVFDDRMGIRVKKGLLAPGGELPARDLLYRFYGEKMNWMLEKDNLIKNLID